MAWRLRLKTTSVRRGSYPSFTTGTALVLVSRLRILSTAFGDLDLQEMLWRQPPLYRARAEGIEKKPTWKTAFETRRCLIPMHGFYEWDERTQPRQPYHFHLKNDGLFMVAGLWAKHEGSMAFTLITTSPNEVVAQAHHRMCSRS